jgi:hypothetical protein
MMTSTGVSVRCGTVTFLEWKRSDHVAMTAALQYNLRADVYHDRRCQNNLLGMEKGERVKGWLDKQHVFVAQAVIGTGRYLCGVSKEVLAQQPTLSRARDHS